MKLPGLLRSLFARALSLERPSTSLAAYMDDMDVGGADADTGERIDRKAALKYAPVWRAVNLISGDVAKLPLDIYRRDGDDARTRATMHPAYPLLRWSPHPEINAFTFRQTLQAHALLAGNGYAYIERDGAARPLYLLPLCPDDVTVVREAGTLWYIYQSRTTGESRKLRPDQVFHLRGLGYDGLQGYSVITYAANTFGLGIGTRKYGARFFKNAARPSVVLEHPNRMSEEAAARLRDSWNKLHAGLDNAHKTAVLEEGLKAHPLSISARDAQLLDTMGFAIRDVAAWFGIPPHKLGDTTRTSYSSLEQENQAYLDQALDHWLVTWEYEARDKMLTEAEKRTGEVYPEFNRNALVRADLVTRSNAYRNGLAGAPWMTLNEVRRAENLPPLGPEYDTVKLPANNFGPAPEAPPAAAPARAADPAAVQLAAAVADAAEAQRATEAQAAALRPRLEVLLADAERRLRTKVANECRRAAKDAARLATWLGEFRAANAAAAHQMLAPAAAALSAVDGQDPALIEGATCERVYRAVQSAVAAGASSPAALAAELDKLTKE